MTRIIAGTQWNIGVPDKTSVALATDVEGDDRNLYPQFNSIRDANARLIAAAPNLLGALKGIVDWAENQDLPEHIPFDVFQAKRAIAKAEGRE